MKSLLLLGTLSVILLTGCTTNVSEEPTNVDVAENSNQNVSDDSNSATDSDPVSEEGLDDSNPVYNLENYKELEGQDYFDPGDFQAHLITDNEGSRVFIFQEKLEQVYKTIFIKQTNRLKVIDLVNNKLLMDDIL